MEKKEMTVREFARLGGLARAAAHRELMERLTPEEREARVRKFALARRRTLVINFLKAMDPAERAEVIAAAE